MVTYPAALRSPGALRKLQWATDGCMTLESFAGNIASQLAFPSRSFNSMIVQDDLTQKFRPSRHDHLSSSPKSTLSCPSLHQILHPARRSRVQPRLSSRSTAWLPDRADGPRDRRRRHRTTYKAPARRTHCVTACCAQAARYFQTWARRGGRSRGQIGGKAEERWLEEGRTESQIRRRRGRGARAYCQAAWQYRLVMRSQSKRALCSIEACVGRD